MPAHSARRRAGRLVALSLTATTVVGLQAFHGVAQAKDTVNPATGCSEDSFLGGAVSPSPGGVITVPNGSSQTFSVVYHDETAINTNPGFAAQYTVTGPQGVVQSGAPASSGASAPAGTHDKFNTLLSVVYAPPADGKVYTVAIKAWDGDQNKAGGDCGVASWQVTTPAPPTTTTIPHHDTTTTTVPQTTTTTAPSTPQTNVLGETFAQSPTAAPVAGTPALTG